MCPEDLVQRPHLDDEAPPAEGDEPLKAVVESYDACEGVTRG